MEGVQKSFKCQRHDDADDYIPSVEFHAAEVKLSQYAEEVNGLKNTITEVTKELEAVWENFSKLSSERDALSEKLTNRSQKSPQRMLSHTRK